MNVYPSYLLCLFLMIPALGLAVVAAAMTLFMASPKEGFSAIIHSFAFFGAGIAEPLRYGWRIIALLLTIGFFLTAGAIPQLRTLAFYGLGVLGTLCVAFCLFAASREDMATTLTALFVLTPSLAGITACMWFATKYA